MTRTTARRRSPIAGFALVLAALIVTGFVYSAVSGFSGTADAATTSTTSQIESGKQLYLQSCSSCHGLAAEGTNNGPTLIGVGAAAVDFQVGTGRMPAAYPSSGQIPKKPVQFTDEQIAQLAAYVASLSPGPAIPTEEELDYSNADLALGGELFRTNCAQCHNFAAQGGALTGGKYAPNLTRVSAKHIYEAMLTGPQNMPVFGNATMRPEDKLAIIKYVRSLEKEPNPGGASLGKVGPVTEGAVGWIVGLGALIGVSVWIGVKAS